MPMTFDDVKVGDKWRSTGRTLTEAELTLACMTSGDWHPIHADAQYAKSSVGGQRIFQGTYCLHVAVAMATHFPDIGPAVIGALGFKEWKFLAPVVPGDTVHVEVEITGKRLTSDGKRGLIERRIKLVNHSGATVQEGIATMMAAVGGAS
ncbi:MAG: MaoC/PaaZ C-terminal domain-containing protein [Pseudomonadota bacterium]